MENVQNYGLAETKQQPKLSIQNGLSYIHSCDDGNDGCDCSSQNPILQQTLYSVSFKVLNSTFETQEEFVVYASSIQ